MRGVTELVTERMRNCYTYGYSWEANKGSTWKHHTTGYIGIAQNSLSRYERGEKTPDAKFLENFCSYLNISSDWLIFGRGPMRPGEKIPEPEHHQQPVASSGECARCVKLEAKLEKMEEQRDELAAENRNLWKENGELREKCARLEERMDKPLVSRGTAEMGNLG